MVDQTVQSYCDSLTALGIENAPVEHPASREIADVLDSLSLSFADCMPTIIMKADDNFIAISIRGDTRVNFKKVKRAFGVSDLRMATPDEFAELTGLPLGAARVYNPGVLTILDTKIFEKEYLTGGSGCFDYSVKVKTADLTKIPDSTVADVHKEAS